MKAQQLIGITLPLYGIIVSTVAVARGFRYYAVTDNSKCNGFITTAQAEQLIESK